MLENQKQKAISELPHNHSQDEEDEVLRIVEESFFRYMGTKHSYFLAVHILKQSWMDTDYCYRLCCDVDKNKWTSNLWVIAREHLKSTVITALSTLREILENPNLTYCILSFKPDTASEFLSIITNWVSSEGEGGKFVRSLYSDILWEHPSKGYEYLEDGTRKTYTWNMSEITVKRTIECKEPTIGIAGIEGGSITGMHYSRLIFDDAETSDSVKTPENIERVTQTITNLFNAGQTENFKFVMVGTFYTREDTYIKLMKSNIVKNAVVQPCWSVQDEEGIYYSKKTLLEKKERMTPQVWATQMECDPSMSSSNTFDPKWIKYWELNSGWDNMLTYTIVDPAGTPTNKSDYTAIVTFSINFDSRIFIRDIIRDKLDLDAKFLNLSYVYRTFRPQRILYEKVGMQADYEYIKKCMDEKKIYFPLETYATTKNKIQKISNMIPHIRGGLVVFPKECWHRNWQGQIEDMCESTIMNELLAFPSGLHDDAIDCIATFVAMNDAHIFEIPDASFISNNNLMLNDDNMNYILEYDPHDEIIRE